jgi:hypothetical protein
LCRKVKPAGAVEARPDLRPDGCIGPDITIVVGYRTIGVDVWNEVAEQGIASRPPCIDIREGALVTGCDGTDPVELVRFPRAPPNAEATNTGSFTALPGGYRVLECTFIGAGGNALFWTAMEGDASGAGIVTCVKSMRKWTGTTTTRRTGFRSAASGSEGGSKYHHRYIKEIIRLKGDTRLVVILHLEGPVIASQRIVVMCNWQRYAFDPLTRKSYKSTGNFPEDLENYAVRYILDKIYQNEKCQN